MADVPRFDFPPLGDTGAGEMVPVDEVLIWKHPRLIWRYYVTRQHDVPAVAYRCHYVYTEGADHANTSAPCDRATAERFIVWASALA